MRILFVNDHAHVTGGADVHCFDLARVLEAAGHEVALLSTAHPDNLDFVGRFVPLTVSRGDREGLAGRAALQAGAFAFWNPQAARATGQLVESFRPDVLHAHKLYPQLSVAPIAVAAHRGIPIVQTVHDYEFVSASLSDHTGSRLDRDEKRLSYRSLNAALLEVRRRVHRPRVTRWVSISRYIGDICRRVGGFETETIPNFAISRDREPADLSRRRAVLFAGRLEPEKGIPDLIQVARDDPGLEISIAGAGTMSGDVARAAAELPSLTYLGLLSQGEVREHLEEARILAVPSRWQEPGGLIALEAMAAGTPVVAYATGGLAEYVEDGGGITVEPTRQALAEGIRVASEPERWRSLSERGREAAATLYSPDRYLDEISKVYEAAIGEAKKVLIRRGGTGRRALSALRRFWPTPVGAVLCALLCWGVAVSQSNSYHATAILLFHEGSISDQLVGYSSSIYIAPEREAATNDKLVELPAVATGASKRIGDELSPKDVGDRVEVLTDPQSNIVRIVADDVDPKRAAAVANAYANSYVALRRGADQRKLRQAIRQLHTEYTRLAEGTGTRTQLETLQFGIGRLEGLTATQVGNAQIVQHAAVPKSAASPLPALDAALGATVGAVFGLAMTVGLGRRGSAIRSPEDLAAATDIPVIDSLVADSAPTGAIDDDERSALAFRAFAVLAPWPSGTEQGRSVIVTGAPPTDIDKAYAAASLAIGAAREGIDTALVDCDIWRPSLARIFGLADAPGIIDVLRGRCTLGDVLHDITPRPGKGNLAVISAGAATIDDRYLFDAGDPDAFKARLRSLGFDLLVICAPSLPAPDLGPFLDSGDPVVVSYRLGTGRDVDARLIVDRLRPSPTSFAAAMTTKNQMESLRDLGDRESASF